MQDFGPGHLRSEYQGQYNEGKLAEPIHKSVTPLKTRDPKGYLLDGMDVGPPVRIASNDYIQPAMIRPSASQYTLNNSFNKLMANNAKKDYDYSAIQSYKVIPSPENSYAPPQRYHSVETLPPITRPSVKNAATPIKQEAL